MPYNVKRLDKNKWNKICIYLEWKQKKKGLKVVENKI